MGQSLWCDKCALDGQETILEVNSPNTHQMIISTGKGRAFSLDLCEEHMEELWKELELLRG